MSVDRRAQRSVAWKPSRYLPWGGDPGGDFYRPPRAAATQCGPTAFDVSMDAMPNANQVELHFANYSVSGEMSRLPRWVRPHWTADAERPRPKPDRRAAAFKEAYAHKFVALLVRPQHCPAPTRATRIAINTHTHLLRNALAWAHTHAPVHLHPWLPQVSGVTVVPGPYWGGLPGASNVPRPGTGAVLTPQNLLARTASFAHGMATPAGPTHPPPSARQPPTLPAKPQPSGAYSSETASARARAAADGDDFGGVGPGYATPKSPGRAARLEGAYLFGQPQPQPQHAGGGSPEPAPAAFQLFRVSKGAAADSPAMARGDKIVNSSPAKNANNAALRHAYSGRDAPSRRGPRLHSPRGSALLASPVKSPVQGGYGGGFTGPLSSARGVGAAEAQAWTREKGCWGERPW